MMGDNLASNAMGGFKDSFSFAFRMCRTCMVTKENYKSQTKSSELVLRTDDKHQEHCDLIDEPLGDHYTQKHMA